MIDKRIVLLSFHVCWNNSTRTSLRLDSSIKFREQHNSFLVLGAGQVPKSGACALPIWDAICASRVSHTIIRYLKHVHASTIAYVQYNGQVFDMHTELNL